MNLITFVLSINGSFSIKYRKPSLHLRKKGESDVQCKTITILSICRINEENFAGLFAQITGNSPKPDNSMGKDVIIL